jgi:hypothetical protein
MKTQTKSKTNKGAQPSTVLSKEVIMASIIGTIPIMALYLNKLQNEKKSNKEKNS